MQEAQPDRFSGLCDVVNSIINNYSFLLFWKGKNLMKLKQARKMIPMFPQSQKQQHLMKLKQAMMTRTMTAQSQKLQNLMKLKQARTMITTIPSQEQMIPMKLGCRQ